MISWKFIIYSVPFTFVKIYENRTNTSFEGGYLHRNIKRNMANIYTSAAGIKDKILKEREPLLEMSRLHDLVQTKNVFFVSFSEFHSPNNIFYRPSCIRLTFTPVIRMFYGTLRRGWDCISKYITLQKGFFSPAEHHYMVFVHRLLHTIMCGQNLELSECKLF